MLIDVVFVRPFDPTRTRLDNLFIPEGSDKEVFVLYGFHLPEGQVPSPERLDKELGGGFRFANWWESKNRKNACNEKKVDEIREFTSWMEYIFPKVIENVD